MAKPIKFRLKRQFQIVNRCIMCGRIIPQGFAICATCNRERLKGLIKAKRK